jgi:predicted ArsR family transcriptional regulator
MKTRQELLNLIQQSSDDLLKAMSDAVQLHRHNVNSQLQQEQKI